MTNRLLFLFLTIILFGCKTEYGETKAYVTQATAYSRSNHHYKFQIHCEYEVKDKQYEIIFYDRKVEVDMVNSLAYEKGDTLLIKYDKKNPQKAYFHRRIFFKKMSQSPNYGTHE